MSKHEERKVQRAYHATVGVLTLVGGLTLLAFGIWLTATDDFGALSLDLGEEYVARNILRANIGAMAIGGFLALLGIVSLLSLARRCVGATFRVLFVLLALLTLAALVAVCAVSSLIVARRDHAGLRDELRRAWRRTARAERTALCVVEAKFQCRGFDDGDCDACLLGVEDSCSQEQKDALCVPCPRPTAKASVGCYDGIKEQLRSIFLPVAIVSGILAGVVLVDILVTFCL